jgi:NitT/TauT family transport system substrate-binding protein
MRRREVLVGALGGGVLGAAALAPMGFAQGRAEITVALQEGGTASWELAAMVAVGLDAAQGITINLRNVADSRAGHVALQAGEVDVILSDFVWVASQRGAGADFAIVPHSLAVGGVMVDPAGTVRALADLAGKAVAVAGGPTDKSYAVLQAYYLAQTSGRLADVIDAKFGAAPLVNELLIGGQVQAALNFWHFNVRARLAGMAELISVRDMLAALGVPRPPPLLGWVFSEAVAAQKADALRRFLDASFATKALLRSDGAIWDTIRPQMRGAEDAALYAALVAAYRDGIVTSYGAQDIAVAAQTYALVAEFVGAEAGARLAEGTFWLGYEV